MTTVKKENQATVTKEAPVLLVKTWIALARNTDPEGIVRKKGLEMLTAHVGGPQQVKDYMKRNNIQ